MALGRIGPETILGGELEIKPELARQAIQETLADPLNLPLHEAAQGVLDVVNANMVRILRVVSVSRGFDPRQFTLVAYGGAGPLHAGDLAQELGVRQLVIPPTPGVFSAMGLLASDIEVTFSATRPTRVTPENLVSIVERLSEVELRCKERLDQEQVPEADRELNPFLEMRYVRQNFELEIPVPDISDSPQGLEPLLRTFHEAHQRTYGHSDERDPAEIVNFKVRGVGRVVKPRFRGVPEGSADAGQAHTGIRQVFFRQTGWVECPNYDRSKLVANNRIDGPAVINAFDSTVLLLPGYTVLVNSFGDLIMTRDPATESTAEETGR